MIRNLSMPLPIQKGPILDTINPVKIYEYLAVNKPVIAVRSRETEKFKDIILLYDNLRELERMAIGPFKPPLTMNRNECVLLNQTVGVPV